MGHGVHLDDSYTGLALLSDTAAYQGHLQAARELTRQAVESALLADDKESAAQARVDGALREASFGNLAEARVAANEALNVASTGHVRIPTALVLAMLGDTTRADSVAQDVGKLRPLDTEVQKVWLPTIQARVALTKKNPVMAIKALEAMGRLELGSSSFCLYPVYLRGEAYLAAGNGSAAVSEFQKILDHNGIVWNCWTGALARLQLGRSYAMSGDATKARAAYQDFLALWKDADPDLPLLKQAKIEYAKLQ